MSIPKKKNEIENDRDEKIESSRHCEIYYTRYMKIDLELRKIKYTNTILLAMTILFIVYKCSTERTNRHHFENESESHLCNSIQ